MFIDDGIDIVVARHVRELIRAKAEGFDAYVLFVVQMAGMRYLVPNDATDPDFGSALRAAGDAGVRVLAVECDVLPDRITACRPLPVILK